MPPKSTRTRASSRARTPKRASRSSKKKAPPTPPPSDKGHDFDTANPTSHNKDIYASDDDHSKSSVSEKPSSSPHENKHSAQTKLNQALNPDSYQSSLLQLQSQAAAKKHP